MDLQAILPSRAGVGGEEEQVPYYPIASLRETLKSRGIVNW